MEEEPTTYKEQAFSFEVASPGADIEKSFDLYADFKTIERMGISSTRNDLLYFRGVIKRFSVDGRAVFENFDANIMMATVHHAPDQKYKSLPNIMPANGSQVKIEYKDMEHPNAPFVPYTVRLYVYGESK